VLFLQEYCPCHAEVFESLPQLLVPGHGPSQHFDALVAACDLLVRTVQDRRLQAARKSIVIVSPFAEAIDPVDMPTMVCCLFPCCVCWWQATTMMSDSL
jgi:hypothetical protein